jgi:hypothetical protein
VIRSKKCENPTCGKEIIWSVQDQVFVNVDDRKVHKLSCDWRPQNVRKPVGELILVSSSDFNRAVQDLSLQIKSTQAQVSKTNALCVELAANINAILRNGGLN